MNGVAIQESIDEIHANSGPFDGAGGAAAVDDQTPPEEMDPQLVSPRQRLALEAFCKGGTIGDAAKAANVSRQTLHRWRAKYPHFALAMSSWSSACLSTAESELAELASRAVGALSNAIDKGDARSAMAVLRSLGVLRTYQPSKAPDAARERLNSRAGEQEMNLLAQALADAPQEQLNSRGGEQEKETVANFGRAAAKDDATETPRTGREPAGVLRHQDVTSVPAKAQKPAILTGKTGSAIRMACDSALRDATECYQMLPNGAGQNASPGGVALASCA